MKLICVFLLLACSACKEYYEPPSVKNNPDYLVVDGILNGVPDSTYIKLTHTRNLRDTAPGSPELNAIVMVQGDQNTFIPLHETGNGFYGNLLPLNTAEKYRLTISTTSGKQFTSDLITYKQTPPIDSLSWEEDTTGINFFINTHEPQNNTTHYRWQYEETWQYHTYLLTNFDYVNDTVVKRTEDQMIYNCWKSSLSPTVLLASTSQLSQDVVSHFLCNYVSKSTEQLAVMYSVSVSQYALTPEAFVYWTNLKKNTEQLGTLFDAQPSELNSNIHCSTNPSEPVMGFLSASSIQKKRIFISVNQLKSLNYQPYYLPCQTLGQVTVGIPANDPQKIYEYLVMPKHLFTLWYYDGAYHAAQNFCIDCRDHGGTNAKPSFWP